MKFKMRDEANHSIALFHMIGQLEEMTQDTISTSSIASLMGVSIPTAIKRLKKYEKFNRIERVEIQHRSNAIAYRWKLTKPTRLQFQNGYFRMCYEAWRNEAYG